SGASSLGLHCGPCGLGLGPLGSGPPGFLSDGVKSPKSALSIVSLNSLNHCSGSTVRRVSMLGMFGPPPKVNGPSLIGPPPLLSLGVFGAAGTAQVGQSGGLGACGLGSRMIGLSSFRSAGGARQTPTSPGASSRPELSRRLIGSFDAYTYR